MYDLKQLKKVKKLNDLGLNPLAARKLRQKKVSLDQKSLYLLQLAKWGLEKGLSAEKPSREVLEGSLQKLEESDPEKAQEFLLKSDPESPEELNRTSLSGTPEEAAQQLLMTLAQRLLESPDWRKSLLT